MKNSPETHQQEKKIYIKRELFEMIRKGKKTLELRVAFDVFKDISEGDHITFSSGSNETIKVEVTRAQKYSNLEEVLDTEDLNKLIPDADVNQALSLAKGIFRELDINRHGLILFEFKKV